MSTMGRLFAVLAFAFTMAGAVQAQTIPEADASLRGLKKVWIEVAADPLTGESHERVRSIVNLELRKAGIRVVIDPSEFDKSRDAEVLVSLAALDPSSTKGVVTLEWTVTQTVTVTRTGESMKAVTWRRTNDTRESRWTQKKVETILRETMDEFLSAWLSANGR